MATLPAGSITSDIVSDTSVTLYFTAINGADYYMFYYRISGEVEEKSVATPVQVTSVTITDLIPGTRYVFQYCGVDANGDGDSSDFYIITTKRSRARIFTAQRGWVDAVPYIFVNKTIGWKKANPYYFKNDSWVSI